MVLFNNQFFSVVWSTDLNGNCSLWHQSTHRILPSAEHGTLQDWLAAVHADADSAIDSAIVEALGREVPFQLDIKVRCMDGVLRSMLLSAMPVKGSGNAIAGFHGSVVDITERHERLEAALHATAEYGLMIENSSDLIAHCDAEGKYVWVSPSYSKMIGWPVQEMLARPTTDFLHPDDRMRVTAALDHLFAGGALPEVIEVRKEHRDGHFISIGTRFSSITDPTTGNSIGAVLVSRDITNEKQKIEQLERLATRDTLTGLPNRAWINGRVEQMLAHCDDDALTTIFFIDLNGFKAVNDTMGHAAGDVLLQQVGKRLRNCLRPEDSLARLGGDEFVVATKCSDKSSASIIAQRLLDALKVPFAINGKDAQIAAAIGISLVPKGQTSSQVLFHQADTAMYQAKAHPEGAYRFFDAETMFSAE